MTGWVLIALPVSAIVAYMALSRRSGRLGEAIREHATIGERAAFRLGYIMALDDVDRTGLRPLTDATKREAAERAARKVYVER